MTSDSTLTNAFSSHLRCMFVLVSYVMKPVSVSGMPVLGAHVYPAFRALTGSVVSSFLPRPGVAVQVLSIYTFGHRLVPQTL